MTRPPLRSLAVLCLLGLLAACGSDSDDETDTGGSTPTTVDSMTDDSMTDDSMTDDSMTDDSMTDDSMTDDSMTDDSMTDDSMTDGMASATVEVVETPFGPALGDGTGKVLYTWDEEADGQVRCTDDECVGKWPPHLADAVTIGDDLDQSRSSLVERPDGSMQLAVDGRPLYTMALDEPGEANCQGADGWWIVHPDGTSNTDTTPA